MCILLPFAWFCMLACMVLCVYSCVECRDYGCGQCMYRGLNAMGCARLRPASSATAGFQNGDFYDTTRVKNRNIPTAEEGGETAGPVLCREVELERRGTATPTSHPHQGNARLPSASTLLNGQSKRILLSADGERSRVLLRKHSLSCPPR